MRRCWRYKRYKETSLKMPWGLGHRRRSIAQQTKITTATGEDEAEQSLWLALLAGKVEALGQSSQSKCESWRLKGHFPSSSPVWRGAIRQVSVHSSASLQRQHRQRCYNSPALSQEADSNINTCIQNGQGWIQQREAIGDAYRQDQEDTVVKL